MKCPKCNMDLKPKTHSGIELDACPSCEGMWLDFEELDQLEDSVFSRDESKGTTIFATFPSKLLCAKCGQPLKGFKYRYYELELEFCEQEHGFWLDKGEEKRVLELMQQETKSLTRKFDLENTWSKTLRNLKSKDFLSKLRDLFRS